MILLACQRQTWRSTGVVRVAIDYAAIGTDDDWSAARRSLRLRVAHEEVGRRHLPIQPLSLLHEASYADYSHGIGWVSSPMVVDGVERPIADVARDPELAGLLSDEGPLATMRAAAPFP